MSEGGGVGGEGDSDDQGFAARRVRCSSMSCL